MSYNPAREAFLFCSADVARKDSAAGNSLPLLLARV